MAIKGLRKKFVSARKGNVRRAGRAYVLLSTLCFGSIGTFAKLAYQSGVAATQLLSMRFVAAAAVLWVYFLLLRRDLIRIRVRQLAVCAALGLAGYGIFSSLVFEALETVPASISGLLFFSYPVFTLLFDWLARRQRPAAQLIVGAALTLAGIGVGAFGSLRGGLSVGVLLSIAGGAWYGAYVVATRRLLHNQNPQTVGLYVITFAALGFWAAGGAPPMTALSGQAWVAVLWLGVVSTAVAVLAFYAGLEKLGSAEASQIGAFELIVTVLLAGLTLGEPLTAPIISGATLILFGILLGQARMPVRQREAEVGSEREVGSGEWGVGSEEGLRRTAA